MRCVVGTALLWQVTAEISLPPTLALAPDSAPARVVLPVLAPGAQATVTWHCVATDAVPSADPTNIMVRHFDVPVSVAPLMVRGARSQRRASLPQLCRRCIGAPLSAGGLATRTRTRSAASERRITERECVRAKCTSHVSEGPTHAKRASVVCSLPHHESPAAGAS